MGMRGGNVYNCGETYGMGARPAENEVNKTVLENEPT